MFRNVKISTVGDRGLCVNSELGPINPAVAGRPLGAARGGTPGFPRAQVLFRSSLVGVVLFIPFKT